MSIIDHVSVLENFDGLKNHFLVVQHIIKVCNEKNVSNSGAYISIGIHFTENLKVPAKRP